MNFIMLSHNDSPGVKFLETEPFCCFPLGVLICARRTYRYGSVLIAGSSIYNISRVSLVHVHVRVVFTSRRSPPPLTPPVSLLPDRVLSVCTIALICLSYSASGSGSVGGGCGGKLSSCGSILSMARTLSRQRVVPSLRSTEQVRVVEPTRPQRCSSANLLR